MFIEALNISEEALFYLQVILQPSGVMARNSINQYAPVMA